MKNRKIITVRGLIYALAVIIILSLLVLLGAQITGIQESISVQPMSYHPVSDADLDQTVNIGETVQFDGTGSFNPNRTVIVEPIRVVDISSDGKYISIGWGTNVTLFKTSSSEPLWTYDTGCSISAVALSEHGQYLAVGYTNNVAFFETNNSKPLWTYTTIYPIGSPPRKSFSISRNGEYIAVGTGHYWTSTGNIYMFERDGTQDSWSLFWSDVQ